jgi:EAL domain-containing protein (putative c-di-GMP-specific phosphodiesterase class I)
MTERASLAGVGDLRERLAALRALGYRIAVDDLGAGYAALSSFTQLEPDVAKLDMSLIRDIDSDQRKRSLVQSMLTVCGRDLQTLVVCEGVETEGEYQTLSEIGAELFQGYYFAKPSEQFFVGT